VLATICEIETGAEWYFRSCTECASLVTIVAGVDRNDVTQGKVNDDSVLVNFYK